MRSADHGISASRHLGISRQTVLDLLVDVECTEGEIRLVHLLLPNTKLHVCVENSKSTVFIILSGAI